MLSLTPFSFFSLDVFSPDLSPHLLTTISFSFEDVVKVLMRYMCGRGGGLTQRGVKISRTILAY